MSDPRLQYRQYKFCEKQKELIDKWQVILYPFPRCFQKVQSCLTKISNFPTTRHRETSQPPRNSHPKSKIDVPCRSKSIWASLRNGLSFCNYYFTELVLLSQRKKNPTWISPFHGSRKVTKLLHETEAKVGHPGTVREVEIIDMLISFFLVIIISTSLTVPGKPSHRFHVEAWLPFRNREMDFFFSSF